MLLNPIEVTAFFVQMALHAGIIISIWTFDIDHEKFKWRPLVGTFAAFMAGVNACAILLPLKLFFTRPQELSVDYWQVLVVAFLFLAVIQVKGNVAIFVRPIQNFYYMIRGYLNV